MPYDRGKLSVAKGNLRIAFLPNGVVTTGNTFQLPNTYVPTIHHAPARRQKYHRKWGEYSRAQRYAMLKVASELDLDYDITWQGEALAGPEFAFHGSKMPWDAIYDDGGLVPTGENTSISDHVRSSAQNLTIYISLTRELSVAHSFATGGLSQATGEYGFVYLVHVDFGVQIGPGHAHRQAEISAVGKIPIRDILMFKWMAVPRRIYINLDYTATPTPPALIDRCLRLIGGGATP